MCCSLSFLKIFIIHLTLFQCTSPLLAFTVECKYTFFFFFNCPDPIWVYSCSDFCFLRPFQFGFNQYASHFRIIQILFEIITSLRPKQTSCKSPPLSKVEHSYEHFHKLKWHEARKQLPLIYMEKYLSLPRSKK